MSSRRQLRCRHSKRRVSGTDCRRRGRDIELGLPLYNYVDKRHSDRVRLSLHSRHSFCADVNDAGMAFLLTTVVSLESIYQSRIPGAHLPPAEHP